MSIKKLVEKFDELQVVAKRDTAELPYSIRGAAEGQAKEAEIQIKEVEQQYKSAVIAENTVVIAVEGAGSQEFANYAKYGHKTLAVDYQSLVQYLKDRMNGRGAHANFTQNEHFMLLTEINQLKLDLDIKAMRPVEINYMTDGVAEKPLAFALDKIFKNNYAGQLHTVFVRKLIQEEAWKEKFDGKYLPVVVYNYDSTYDTLIMPKPIVTVQAAEGTNEKFVADTLNSVKAKLKPKKTTAAQRSDAEVETTTTTNQ
jgi:hypothetical protein